MHPYVEIKQHATKEINGSKKKLKEIKIYLETNESGNITLKIYRTQ